MCLCLSLVRDIGNLQKIQRTIKVFNGIEILEKKIKNGLDDPRKEYTSGMHGLDLFKGTSA